MNMPTPAHRILCSLILFCWYSSCNNNSQQAPPTADFVTDTAAKGSYGYDAAFLKHYSSAVLELQSTDGQSKVLLSGAYQGRIMTSTATGDSGNSFGWLNYELIATNKKRSQFNPVGGEERFWLGPEGGQYGLYFKKNDSFAMARWQVPAFLDTNAYAAVRASAMTASFSATASFTNYNGTAFSIRIDRTIGLLGKEELQHVLGAEIPAAIHWVAFETVNSITNTGPADFTKEKGLLSVWLLGMFTPGPETKVIIPFYPVPQAQQHITADYFGKIPPNRLQVSDSFLYFTCDGKYRSKIGLSPLIAKPIAGAFDFEKNVLTVLIPEVHKTDAYVNSKWELQKEPYKGDVINAYNDGPLADGTQLGPFFEIESSSAAMALKKAERGVYRQTTCHFQGSYAALRLLAKQLLGVDLDLVKNK